jgi:hypothetical protein
LYCNKTGTVRSFRLRRTRSSFLWVVLGFVLVLISVFNAYPGQGTYTNTIMHPDRETRQRWIQAYKNAPKARIDRVLNFKTLPGGSLSLLSHLKYTPSERDQASCGNCWAWAGTGVMGIALDVQDNILDRLSVQFISSCNTAKSCCEGGWLSDLAGFYTSKGYTIPWSNTNASWQNGDGNCNVNCASIATSPKYDITSIEAQTIETQTVSQAQAISNIKNVLNQNKAVWFAFFMGTSSDWNSFYSFWNIQSESVLWNFDDTCGKPYEPIHAGGHAVLCVGYNDDDPNNSYWIMLNSWGTTPGRPNGLFRVDMDMDYGCADNLGNYNLYWQTLDVAFNASCGLISDGNFENGPPAASRWTEWSDTGCEWIADPTSAWGISAYNGTYAFWTGGYCDGVASSSYVQQSVYFPSCAKTLSFWTNFYRVSADDPIPDDLFTASINGITVFSQYMTQANNTFPNWEKQSVDVSDYAGQTVTLRFEGASTGSLTGNVLVDYIITNEDNFFYVESTGSCGGKTPCYSTIQAAINATVSGATIKIANGSFDEDVTISGSSNLVLSGGWDSTFTTQPANSTVNSMTISNSEVTVAVEYLVIQ